MSEAFKRRWAVVIGVAGAILTIAGLAPIIGALVVANQAIDDGWDASDDALIAQWETWAFAPQWYALAAAGTLLIAVAWHTAWCFNRQHVRAPSPRPPHA